MIILNIKFYAIYYRGFILTVFKEMHNIFFLLWA